MLNVASPAAPPAAVPERLTISPAEHSHATGLRVLVADALAQEGQSWSSKPPLHTDTEITIDDIHALITAQRSQLLVAIEDHVIVGCVLVTRLSGERCALGLLGVNPAYRRRGLGARLIAAAEAAAKNCFGSDQIELCVLAERAKLAAYYERLGFTLTGEHRTVPLADATMEFHVMAKPLIRHAPSTLGVN